MLQRCVEPLLRCRRGRRSRLWGEASAKPGPLMGRALWRWRSRPGRPKESRNRPSNVSQGVGGATSGPLKAWRTKETPRLLIVPLSLLPLLLPPVNPPPILCSSPAHSVNPCPPNTLEETIAQLVLRLRTHSNPFETDLRCVPSNKHASPSLTQRPQSDHQQHRQEV